jgi:hypothetical protein
MEDAEGPAPAADPTRLLPDIIRSCLSDGDASRLALDETLTNATFRTHQIVWLHEFASTDLHIILSARAVACAFNVSQSAVTRAKLRGYEDPPARGQHHEFSPDREAEIVEWLATKAANKTAVNRIELLNECIESFGKSITRGWVDSFLIRHADR